MRFVLHLLVIIAVSACQRGPAAAQWSAPEPEVAPRFILHSGARVHAQLTDRQVIGRLVVPFTPDSQHIAICESRQAPCVGLDDPGTVRLPMDSVKRLQVWGKQSGFGTYFGFYSGALGGSFVNGWSRESGAGLLLGGFLGGALGWAIGSRVDGWVLVFPCYHACAAGEYPER